MLSQYVEYCSYKGLTLSGSILKKIPGHPVEYCSYKGLTLFIIKFSIFYSIVEYCSYKGLTPTRKKGGSKREAF